MSSLAVCDTIMDAAYLGLNEGWRTLHHLLYRLVLEEAWQLSVDVTTIGGAERSIVRERYIELASTQPRLAEWLSFLDMMKGLDAFEEVVVSQQTGFTETLI